MGQALCRLWEILQLYRVYQKSCPLKAMNKIHEITVYCALLFTLQPFVRSYIFPVFSAYHWIFPVRWMVKWTLIWEKYFLFNRSSDNTAHTQGGERKEPGISDELANLRTDIRISSPHNTHANIHTYMGTNVYIY